MLPDRSRNIRGSIDGREGCVDMDFMNPGVLLSGVAISMVGLAVFLYGKKMERVNSLGIGLAMMIFPMFVHSILWMWLIAVGCIAELYIMSRTA